MSSLLVAALFAALSVGAIAAAQARRRPMLRLLKPAATLALIPVVLGRGLDATAALAGAGLVLSAAGDAALLEDGTRRFLVGLGFFLVAHVVFAVALWAQAGWQTTAAAARLAAAVLASAGMVRMLWGRLPRGLRMPVLAYAAAISAMVAGAFAAAVRWSPPAAIAAGLGAVLFWTSDGLLAWSRFRRRLSPSLILGTYWAGQLGLALAFRWSGAMHAAAAAVGAS